MYTQEPPQEGERRVVLNRTGNNIVSISYKIPPTSHPDIPVLYVLSAILEGRKTSRFYKKLIDTSLATFASFSVSALHDASLMQAEATVIRGKKHEDVEKAMKKIFADIIAQGVTADELTAAKRSSRIGTARSRDGVYALLSAINEDIASGDWTRFVTDGKSVQKVTAKDVQRVAKTYFKEEQSTVGWFVDSSQK